MRKRVRSRRTSEIILENTNSLIPPMSRVKSVFHTIYGFRELLLVPPLSISVFRIFFSQRRASVFDVVTLAVLLIWSYIIRDKPFRSLPKLLIVTVCLYIFSDFLGAFRSDDKLWELAELRKYIHVFIGALLFVMPLEQRTRKLVVVIYFIAAAVAGSQGVWHYYSMGMLWRGILLQAQGSLPHAILYAETLALAFGSALLMLFSPRQINEQRVRSELLFLAIVSLLTLGGILFSAARGVWVAVAIAITVTQFLYDRRKALIFLSYAVIAVSILLTMENSLRDRAKSIVTSIYAENESGSTGTRIELWKGSFMIFKEHPLLGAGSGNFESNIKKLVVENKIKKTPLIVHAHNVYLQELATRGLVGFAILVALLVALIKWGLDEIKMYGSVGGYIIIFCAIMTMVGGLTENNLGTTKYLAAYAFTLGLFGPLGRAKEGERHLSRFAENFIV